MWCKIFLIGVLWLKSMWVIALAKSSYLTDAGVVVIDTGKEVIIDRDSILVTVVYDLTEVETMWNSFITSAESLSSSVGKNDCVSKIIADSRVSRYKIKTFLQAHRAKIVKRQALAAGLFGGLTSIISLGFSTYELSRINNKLGDIKQKLGNNERKIEIINKAIKYNSIQLETLRDLTVHTGEILEQMKAQLLNNIKAIDDIRLNMVCLNMKMSYIKLSNMINLVMHELRELLNMRFDINLISWEMKVEICENVQQQGFQTYGLCTDFELLKEINYMFLEKKIIVINKIPIVNRVDNFNLVKLIPIPINIRGEWFKVKDISNVIAKGNKFRTSVNVNECTNFKGGMFCSSEDEYMNANETLSCMGSLLNNNITQFKNCNFDKMGKMEDTVINNKGTYYFSVEKPITMELLCVDTLKNSQLKLKGLGHLVIQKNCYAKKDSLLLVGSNTYSLNTTFQIANKFSFNDSLLKVDVLNNVMKNLYIKKYNISGFHTDQKTEYILDYNLHTMYYIIITLFLITLVMTSILLIKLRVRYHPVLLKNDNINLNSSIKNDTSKKVHSESSNVTNFNNEENIDSHLENNSIPEDALSMGNIIQSKTYSM